MKKKAKTKAKPKAKPERPAGRMAQVSELKAGLSAYLARVKRGEEVMITERGEFIAKIVPIERHTGDEWERIYQLAREGRIRLGTGHIPDDFWTMPRPARVTGSAAVDAVLADREEGY
jgi:prevent-host-death family protein